MASTIFAVKGSAYSFYCALYAQTGNQVKSNPTLASGDVTISKDGGTFANLATLPVVTPASSKQVLVALSSGEMTADKITIQFDDASGAEWHSVTFIISTVAAGYDALALAAALQTVDDNVDAVLLDTGTTLDALIKDVPTVAEFEARSVASATYATATALQTVDDNVDAVLVDTNDLQGNQGNWLTATGFSTLDASGVRTAVGLATANLDTQLADLPTNSELTAALASADDAVLAAIGALNNLAASAVVTAMEAATIDGTVTRLQKERVELAVLAGKSTGGGTSTITFRDATDAKARVTATVDGDGNRTAITVDGS